MGLEQLKIREIVKRAVNKGLDVPEFQRQFVWDPEQVKLLLESLYRAYPIGSFLLWENSEYEEPRTAQGTQTPLWIVDGQQRVTALCLLLGQKPYWWSDSGSWNKALERYNVMISLATYENGQPEFGLPNPVRRSDPRWLEVRRVLGTEKLEDLTRLVRGTSERIPHTPTDSASQSSAIDAQLHRLWQTRELEVPVIKIDHEVEDVAEIFARLNQEGTRVREADVVLALAAVRNKGWVRGQSLPFHDGLRERGWDLGVGVLVRTTTGIGCNRATLKEVPKDFWSPSSLPQVWKRTESTVSEVLRRLAEHGIVSSDLLPSANSLIPLFVLHNRWANGADYVFKRAMYWFLMANWDGRYSGAAMTSLNEDVRTIAEAAGFRDSIEGLERRLRVSPTVDSDMFKVRYDRAGNRFLRLMLYLLLYERGAKDWVDGTRLGYDNTGSPIAMGFQPQWHHIYPRSVLTKANLSDDDKHSLANMTVLNERTNVRRISGKEPKRYISEFGVSSEMLSGHLVSPAFATAASNDRSALERQWDIGRYKDFVDQRAGMLADAAGKFLQSLKMG